MRDLRKPPRRFIADAIRSYRVPAFDPTAAGAARY